MAKLVGKQGSPAPTPPPCACMHVCERVLCTLVMVLVEGRDNKFPGAGVTAVVSCLARVLGIKLGSSVRVSMLNCSAPSRPIAAFVKHGHTEVGGSDAALEACHPVFTSATPV